MPFWNARPLVRACAVALLVLLAVDSRTGAAEDVKTIFSWSRDLNTCDKDRDVVIPSAATTRVVYAFSDEPTEDMMDYASIPRHSHKGAKTVALVGNPPKSPDIEVDAVTVDLKVSNVHVRADPADPESEIASTVYYCKSFQMPDIAVKNHVVKYEPIIAESSLSFVHHMLYYLCDVDEFEDYEGTCKGSIMPKDLGNCRGAVPLAAWAIGGSAFFTPPEAGFPIGPGRQVLLLEMHYDNPGKLPLSDSSGMRFWFTPSLRLHDAGILSLGMGVGGHAPIPPGEKNYELAAHCPGECTQYLPEEGVFAFSNMLHAHLAGRHLRLQHFRNRAELATLDENPQYDFNLQEVFHFPKEILIRPRDSFRITCWYDTSDRTEPTEGGIESKDEMCLSYLAVYPYKPEYRMGTCLDVPLQVPVRQEMDSTITDDMQAVLCPAAGTAPEAKAVSCFGSDSENPSESIPRCLAAFPAEPAYDPYRPPDPCRNYERRDLDRTPRQMGEADWRPEVQFDHSLALDTQKKFTLYWKHDVDAERMDFGIEVHTAGWVGFGISPHGGMVGADIALGFVVPSGTEAYFQDHMALRKRLPVVDDVQDLYNVRFMRCGNAGCGVPSIPPPPPDSGGRHAEISPLDGDPLTVVQWRRRMNTCDTDGDLELEEQSSHRVVWGVGPSSNAVPDAPRPRELRRHAKVGGESLNLAGRALEPPTLAPGTKSVKLQFHDIHVSADPHDGESAPVRTVYFCKAFKLPDTAQQKRHLVKFDVVIPTLADKPFLHHMLLYQCTGELNEEELAFADLCGGGNMPPRLQACYGAIPINAWAVGGEAFYLPQEAGFPMGDAPGHAQYLILEAHLDNPRLQNVAVSGGMELWYTDTTHLRPHDAGVLQVGMAVGAHAPIPPGEEDYVMTAHCPSECTQKLPREGLTVFASFLHEHMAGTGLELQWYRNERELEVFDKNPFFDFNFQQWRVFPTPKIVEPEDSFKLTCHYDTSDRTQPTRGGLSSDEEMCLTYLAYYPYDLAFGATSCQEIQVPERRPNPELFPEELIHVFCPNADASPHSQSVECAPPSPDNLYRPCRALFDWPQLEPREDVDECHGRAVRLTDNRPEVVGLDSFDRDAYANRAVLLGTPEAPLYQVYWTHDFHGDFIDFAVEAATDSWVGFGISPTGDMKGADIVFAYASNDGRRVSVTDRMALDTIQPYIDEQQDLENVRFTKCYGDRCLTPRGRDFFGEPPLGTGECPSAQPSLPPPRGSTAAPQVPVPTGPLTVFMWSRDRFTCDKAGDHPYLATATASVAWAYATGAQKSSSDALRVHTRKGVTQIALIGAGASGEPAGACAAVAGRSTDVRLVTFAAWQPTSFEKSKALDRQGKFKLYWTFDRAHDRVDFAMAVETDGWAAVGVSPGEEMAGTDVALGWVAPDGSAASLTDRMALEHSEPPVDEQQDLYNIRAIRCAGGRCLEPNGDGSLKNELKGPKDQDKKSTTGGSGSDGDGMSTGTLLAVVLGIVLGTLLVCFGLSYYELVPAAGRGAGRAPRKVTQMVDFSALTEDDSSSGGRPKGSGAYVAPNVGSDYSLLEDSTV